MTGIRCDRCGREYWDEPSVSSALEGATHWQDMCKRDNVSARGIAPCPTVPCPGEMIVITR